MNYHKLKKSELIELIEEQIKELENIYEELESDLQTNYVLVEDVDFDDIDAVNNIRELKLQSEFSEYAKEELQKLIEEL